MRLSKVDVRLMILLLCILTTAACSKEGSSRQTASPAQPQSSAPASQPQVQQAAESQPQPAPAQTASIAAPANMGDKAGSAPATEKYRLNLTNYANVAVTISVNGQWVGQWDSNTSAPLESVVQGKNQLTVELASEPKNTVTVSINTRRDTQDVTILSLNFQGQTGSHTYTFMAR